MRIYDVTVPLSEQTIPYYGDPKVKLERLAKIENGICDSSLLSMCVHTGTHVDAPKHFIKGGLGIDGIPIETLIGGCKVFEIKSDEKISLDEIHKFDISSGNRIIFKTRNSKRGFKEFYKDFVYLDEDATTFLINKKIKLVGTDGYSIEKFRPKDYVVHKALLSSNIAIAECLDLKEVTPGDYFLYCVPLKIVDCEAAPARVLLMEK